MYFTFEFQFAKIHIFYEYTKYVNTRKRKLYVKIAMV